LPHACPSFAAESERNSSKLSGSSATYTASKCAAFIAIPCTRSDHECDTGLPSTAKIAVSSLVPVGGSAARKSFTRSCPGAVAAGSGNPAMIAGAAYVNGEPKIGASTRVKLPFGPEQNPMSPPPIARTNASTRKPSSHVSACVTILIRSPSYCTRSTSACSAFKSSGV
jgi:hypothetical protein